VVRASEKRMAGDASSSAQPFASPPLSAAAVHAAPAPAPAPASAPAPAPAQLLQGPAIEMKAVDAAAQLPSIPGSTELPSIPNTPIDKL